MKEHRSVCAQACVYIKPIEYKLKVHPCIKDVEINLHVLNNQTLYLVCKSIEASINL